MSVSTFIKAIKPPNKKWREMKAVYDSCVKAGISIPDEVTDFFDGDEPNEKGVEIDLRCSQNQYTNDGDIHPSISIGHGDSTDYWDVDLSKLPDGVKFIRFINHY
jgi:hypothetical protein